MKITLTEDISGSGQDFAAALTKKGEWTLKSGTHTAKGPEEEALFAYLLETHPDSVTAEKSKATKGDD